MRVRPAQRAKLALALDRHPVSRHGEWPPCTCLSPISCFTQLIFSVFKTLTDQRVTVELKNDLSITGVLKSVDQCVRFICPSCTSCADPAFADTRFLNIRLDNIKVLDEARHPHMVRSTLRCADRL